jgi:hypothetical protein
MKFRPILRQHVRSAVALLVASLTVAGTLAVAGPASAAAANSTALDGVFCTSAANCWAVGNTQVKGVQLNLVLHWTGRKWFKVTVPSPGGTRPNDLSELVAVRCTTAADCWAVGDAVGSRGIERNQALHWDGKTWLVVRMPAPGAAFDALTDVSCTSPSSCWAVGAEGPVRPALAGTGSAGSAGPAGVRFFELNEVLHWNGTKWSVVSAPSPAGTGADAVSALESIRCASAVDCWAAGTAGRESEAEVFRNQMLHWNGRKWAQVTVPNPAGTKSPDFNEIIGLSCTSSANCWAAGAYGTSASSGKFLNEALHWNGRKWFKASVPNPDGTATGVSNVLTGVNCSSPTECWAVGHYGGGSATAETNQALHWNGTHWSKISTPNPGGLDPGNISTLNSVRCTAAANCWAVGIERTGNGAEVGQILHWNGKKWLVSRG